MTDWPGTLVPENDEWPGTLQAAPHTAGEIVADVAKSAGANLGRGVIDVAGLPGDMQSFRQWLAAGPTDEFAKNHPDIAGIWSRIKNAGSAVGSSAHRALDRAGVPTDAIADAASHPYSWLGRQLMESHPKLASLLMAQGKISREGSLPTSGELQGNVERFTGPFYEAQTTPGKYVGAAARFIPSAVATGGENLLPNVIKGGVIPGIASEAGGEALEGTPYEWLGRVTGGIGGAGVGQLGHMASNALATRNAAVDVAGQVGHLVGDPNITPTAVKWLGEAVRDDQLTPQMAALRMARLGPEGMLIDASGPSGSQLVANGVGAAHTPGLGQRRLVTATEGRTGRLDESQAMPGEYQGPSAQRVKDTLNTEMGLPPDIVDMHNRILAASNAQARPIYDSVMQAHPQIDMPADITSRLAIRNAMGQAEGLASNYGENLRPPVTRTTTNAAGVPITETVPGPLQTSLRYWDYVKKALDNRIRGLERGYDDLTSQDKADLGGLRSARRALVEHLDNVTNGQYATARQVWAQGPQLTDALDMGRDALRTGILREEAAENYNGLSIPQQSMYRIGMRRQIEHDIDAAGNDAAKARSLLRTNNAYNKIADVFGVDTANEINRRVNAETAFQEVTRRIAHGSDTARNQAAQQKMAPPNSAAAPSANPVHWVTTPVMNWYSAGQRTALDRSRAAAASMLTAPADQVPDLVRLLSGYNVRAAANSRPSVSPLARTLAGVGAVRAINNLPTSGQRNATSP